MIKDKKDTKGKFVAYTNREQLEALPKEALRRFGDEEKLEPLPIPKGFERLWQEFFLLRQICGSEASLQEVHEFTSLFMPEAQRTDIYMLCVMNNTARNYAYKMDENPDIAWPKK